EAGILAFRESKEKMGLTLLEPIMELEVTTPEDCYGDVLNNVISRKGVINKVEKSEKDLTIHTHVPLANLLDYNAELLNATSGEGVFDMELSHYQKVPRHAYTVVVADVIVRYKKSQGYQVYFQTGSDDHGEKIEKKAATLNISPAELLLEQGDIYLGKYQGDYCVTCEDYVRKIEPNETLKAAAKREIFEETNLTITDLERIGEETFH
ncbi:5719_t:CDS:2, partial [Racocetra persica]